jgi:hypothetical protein
MKRFHIITGSGIKSTPIADLEAIRVDLGLPMPKHGKRVLKRDYIALLTNYMNSDEYARHRQTYVLVKHKPFDQIPEIYRTREVRRSVNMFHYLDHSDMTFDRCLSAVRRPDTAKHVPMRKFSPEQRHRLISVSCSADILAGLPVAEVVPWLARWPLALAHVSYGDQTAEMCQECVLSTGWALQHCAPQLVTDAMELWALRDTPYAVQWLRRDDTERYAAFCDEALALEPWSIEFMPQTPERREAALHADWKCCDALQTPLSRAELDIIEEAKRAIREEYEQTREERVLLVDL